MQSKIEKQMGYHMCFMKIEDVHERTIFVELSLLNKQKNMEYMLILVHNRLLI